MTDRGFDKTIVKYQGKFDNVMECQETCNKDKECAYFDYNYPTNDHRCYTFGWDNKSKLKGDGSGSGRVDCYIKTGFKPIICPMRFVDCSKKGGYDPKDKCKQSCMADTFEKEKIKEKPKPIMCIKRYVDCSKRGGYDPNDKCRQKCKNKTEDKTVVTHKYLDKPDTVKLNDLEVKKMEGEVMAFFKMGAVGMKAWGSFMQKQYKSYMEWNMKFKNEPDNLTYKYRMSYFRTRYGQYKRLYYVAKKKDMVANKVKYEEEAKKKQAADLKKKELEKAAFEKQENVLLEEFEKAKQSKERATAIKELMTKQLKNYQRAIEWAKKTAVDSTMTERAKLMAKRSAMWEQKKYVTLRNEIHQDQIKQESAKKEAEKDAVEAAEKVESAGMQLTKDERKNLYADIKKVTSVVFTGDKEKDIVLKKHQLTEVTKLADGFHTKMVNIKSFMSRARLTQEGLKAQKTEYYRAKISWETVMRIVTAMRKAMETKEAFKTNYKIADAEKDLIGKQVEKYQNYKATGDAVKDKVAGNNLLKKFEDNARMSVERYKREMNSDPKNEAIKTKYFQMRDKYMTIAKMTGYNSPAKVAVRKDLEEAQANQKKMIVVGSVKVAVRPKEVAKALANAGVKKEVVEVLEEQDDNEDLTEVIKDVKADPEVQEKLSEKLVKAKDEDEVAEAIEEAKTEIAVKKEKDPVKIKLIKTEAKIAVCTWRTEIKAKKIEKEVEKKYEEAETEE